MFQPRVSHNLLKSLIISSISISQLIKTLSCEWAIPWSGSKWCYLIFCDRYTDRSTVTQLGTNSEDDIIFMSVSSALLPKTGTCFATLGMSVTMHQRPNSTTPDHGIRAYQPCACAIIDLIEHSFISHFGVERYPQIIGFL